MSDTRHTRSDKLFMGNRPVGEAIQLVTQAPEGGFSGPMRFQLMLIVFMRILSGLWILRGLVQWAEILTPAVGGVETITTSAQMLLIFFAVFNLIAAIGLWLGATWGGVLWLFAVAAEFVSAIFVPRFSMGGWVVGLMNLLLVGVYIFLTWAAAQERDG